MAKQKPQPEQAKLDAPKPPKVKRKTFSQIMAERKAAQPPRTEPKKPAVPPPAPANGYDHAGRPTLMTETLIERVCQLTREGMPLRKIADQDHMPAFGTIVRWLGSEGDSFEQFRAAYARARETRALTRHDDLEDIKDRVTNKARREDRLDPQEGRVAADIVAMLIKLENPGAVATRIVHGNDPKHPLTNPDKPVLLSDEQLHAIAFAGREKADG